MSDLVEILSVSAELFLADGQTARWTDMTNLIVAFRNFANAPKKYWILMQLAVKILLNPLTPNDPYMGRTAPLTSRCCILHIYSTNIHTEYFKHAA